MTEQLTRDTSRLYRSDEFEPLLARLDEIAPVLRRNGAANERAGTLTDEVVRALHESGVFRMSIPRELGGYELTPRQAIEVIEKVSYADASTGWVVMALQMITGTTAAYLGDAATRELFADGGYALVAGQGTRLGQARQVDGGYLVSGQWSFASGIHLASYLHSAALVAESGQALIFTFPKELATQADNWDVMGLKATASIDYHCTDVFVPDSHTYQIATLRPRHGGAVYRTGLANQAGICHTGWALGVGRRLLDELRELALRKSGAPSATVDTAEFHAAYARAESALRSARAWVMDVWADNEATLDAGEPLSTEQETLTRLSLNNTTWSAHAVCLTAYKWAGTAALRDGDLQRFFRDMHAGTQHVTSGPVVLQNCGRQLAGMAPNARWMFLDLVEPA